MPQRFSSYSLVSDFWDQHWFPHKIHSFHKKHEYFRIKGFHLFCKGELKHFPIYFTSMLICFLTIVNFTHFKILYYRQTQTIYYVTNSDLKLLDFLSCALWITDAIQPIYNLKPKQTQAVLLHHYVYCAPISLQMSLIALKLEKTRLKKQRRKHCGGKMWALISEACCSQNKISLLLGCVPLFRSQWFQLRSNLLPSDTPFTLWGRGNILPNKRILQHSRRAVYQLLIWLCPYFHTILICIGY